MAESLRKVDYFYVMVGNTPGAGLDVLKGLADEGVNLLAFSGFPAARKAQLDLVPEDPAALRKAARKLGLALSERKTVFLYQADDRAGAMTTLLEKIAGAGINLTAVDAVSSGDGRFGAIFWVKPPDVAKAWKALSR